MFVCCGGVTPKKKNNNNKNLGTVLELVKRGQYTFPDSTWGTISPAGKHLVQCLMTVDPRQRYGYKQVLNHPWMQGSDELPEHFIAQTSVSNLKISTPPKRRVGGGRANVTRHVNQPFVGEFGNENGGNIGVNVNTHHGHGFAHGHGQGQAQRHGHGYGYQQQQQQQGYHHVMHAGRVGGIHGIGGGIVQHHQNMPVINNNNNNMIDNNNAVLGKRNMLEFEETDVEMAQPNAKKRKIYKSNSIDKVNLFMHFSFCFDSLSLFFCLLVGLF